MTATERVRELLDERGVEWRERVWGGKQSVTTFWHARGVRWHYRENRFGDLRLHADGLVPEQAIAATLGRGMLTAEQVRGVLLLHLPHREYYSIEQTDGWQAIADELNATLGSCNCSDNCTNDCTKSERTETCHDTGESRIFHCSECGLGLDDVFIDDEEHYPFADFPRFCPFCGAKVVGSTTNDVDAVVDDG